MDNEMESIGTQIEQPPHLPPAPEDKAATWGERSQIDPATGMPIKTRPSRVASREFTVAQSVVLDGAGNGTITLGPAPLGKIWDIERLTVRGPAAGTVVVYVDSALDSNFVDETTTWPAVADNAQAARVSSGQSVLVVITGGGAGVIATVRLQVVEQGE